CTTVASPSRPWEIRPARMSIWRTRANSIPMSANSVTSDFERTTSRGRLSSLRYLSSNDAGGFQEVAGVRRELRNEWPVLIMSKKTRHQILGAIGLLVFGIGEEFLRCIIPNLEDSRGVASWRRQAPGRHHLDVV